MSRAACIMAGIILITVPSIEFGGRFLLTQILGAVLEFVDDPQRSALLRAGHGHAGVLVILALWAQWAIDHVKFPQWLSWSCRAGFPLAAVLVSAGFFATAASLPADQPNIVLVVGALLLAAVTLLLGAGLIGWRRPTVPLTG